MDTHYQQDNQSIVEHKVRRRVAIKVLRDIQQRAEEIERQVQAEKRATRYILPLVLVLLSTSLLITLWPFIPRLLKSFINAG